MTPGGFRRHVITIAMGTMVAQAVPVLASPLLTRMFSPEDFGALALYVSLVAIGAIVATGRYELAVLLPELDEDAWALTQLAIAVAAAAALLLMVPALLVWQGRLVIRSLESLGAAILLVPVGVALTATTQSLGYWLNRRSDYRQLAVSRVSQSVAMIGTQLGVGLKSPAGTTLLIGHLAGQVAAIVMQVRAIGAQWLRISGDRQRIRAMAKSYGNHPRFLVLGHAANAASVQLPVLLLTTLHNPAVAGFYALAERVLVLPSALIGSAVGDVYRERAAAEYRLTGNCRALYLRTLRHLAILSVGPVVLIVLVGPATFAFAFGGEWRTSGHIAAILGPMVFFQLISSPLSQTVYLAQMHRMDMVWQVARLGLSAAALVVGAALGKGHELTIAVYAAVFAGMHIVHSLMQYRAACGWPYRRGAAVPQ